VDDGAAAGLDGEGYMSSAEMLGQPAQPVMERLCRLRQGAFLALADTADQPQPRHEPHGHREHPICCLSSALCLAQAGIAAFRWAGCLRGIGAMRIGNPRLAYWQICVPFGLGLWLSCYRKLMPNFASSVLFWPGSRPLWLLGMLIATAASCQSWQTGPGYRFMPLPVPALGKTGFTSLPPEQTGVLFTNLLPESRLLTSQILPNGSGVAAGDVDGDGLCDLYFSGLGSGGRLYRNLGSWRFDDITEQAGVARPTLDVTGVAFADIDGDGDLDLIINSIGGGTHIFFNDGQGRFSSGPQVLNPGRGGTSLALADANGDGTLDLYIANYRASTLMDAPGTRFSVKLINGQPVVTMIDGRPLTDPEWTNRFRFKITMGEGGRGKFAHEELGEPDLFLLNDGNGRFDVVSWTGGAFLDENGERLRHAPFDWGLTVVFRDFNQDGSPDLYVCNDFGTPDRFWFNDGHGRFRAAPLPALRQTSLASMAIDVADLNRDGYDDFIVVDMLSRDHRRRLTQRNIMRAEITPAAEISGRPQYPRNTLFLNRGDGTYAEIAHYAGIEASEWSWAPIFLDVDLDGYEDLLIPNGFERDNMNVDAQNRINQAKAGKKMLSRDELFLRRMFPRLATENLAFHNLHNLRFQEVGREWGFNASTISQGACLADLDNDGDLDVIVNNLNEVAGLYRNDSVAPRLAVRLKGRAPNTRGIGARVTVTSGPANQSQEMICGGRYLSCDDTLRVFAAGSSTNRLQIVVDWRSGRRSMVTNAQANCLYEIDETGAGEVPDHQPRSSPRAAIPRSSSQGASLSSANSRPLFEEARGLLDHLHHEEPFDDFSRQPLLPKRLSQDGPGVCWWDVDGDGWQDLLIGTGRGGHLAWYQNNGKGGFKPVNLPPWNITATRDQTTILGWNAGTVLVGNANYEDGLVAGAAVSAYQLGQSRPLDLIAATGSSTGPLALADYDGDGALDLFVGGRVRPGQYPVAAGSRLYRQQAGALVLDEDNSARLREVGLVSGAVWTDLDGDGWPDLVLACEWGPLRVYHNVRGELQETTQALGLAEFSGWWNGVTSGDFDGDGQLDIIATNWGQNTKHENHRQKPLRIYYGDPSENKSATLLEAWFEPAFNSYVPIRMLDLVTRAMPELSDRFPTHQSWAEASIDDVLADRRDRIRFHEAKWLETTLFMNRGGHFEARPLPLDAQLAPAFAACVADYDGDGNEDVFLSQNFFAVEWETSRGDAGRGLWLQGDGRGSLRAVPGQESGVAIYGEQRGAALCDYDADGRVDLVVTQNSAETILLHNACGRPGLRVRLKGSSGNPCGVGALLRVQYAGRLGPAREVHAGSGYWSQDSAVTVLGLAEAPAAVWVRWPGGKTMSVPIPSGAREVLIDTDGRVRSTK
jgi:hypothetical protein